MKTLKLTFTFFAMLVVCSASANGGDRVVCLVDTSEHSTWATDTANSQDTSNVLALCRSQGGVPYIDRTISMK